ncbi:MAG: phycobiliprotein lyase [Oculatellaceae cyanobacterium bins.114]|nr:phycobiliprotein lyase [Oculatellaceae cyanobacterium bins.114]
MDITEFFQQSAGKWLSQRTSHNLASQQSENGKSTVQIEMMPNDAPEVIKLCELGNVDPAIALFGVKIAWDGNIDWQSTKQTGSTLLVPVPDLDKANEGNLLRSLGYAEKTPVSGRYSVGSDDALTLIIETEALYSEERLWFASPNLRLRTSILRSSGGPSLASFCSEIRMGVTQPPAESTPATEGASQTS